MTDSPLMLVKVVLIVGLGAAFVWWQLRDLAREKKRREARDNQAAPPEP
jgi:hypothetical protein